MQRKKLLSVCVAMALSSQTWAADTTTTESADETRKSSKISCPANIQILNKEQLEHLPAECRDLKDSAVLPWAAAGLAAVVTGVAVYALHDDNNHHDDPSPVPDDGGNTPVPPDLGNYRLTVRAVNAWGQQGDPASVSFRIAAPAAPSRIELTPGYFQITATPHLAVYDPTVQFEFWFSEKRIADIRQVETSARYLGTALYWIAASINIKPGHDYYFYVRSVNTVGKSAFVEAVGQPSDDASGYLVFFQRQDRENPSGSGVVDAD